MLSTPPLDIRLSKAQVMAIANNLHHDECGIEAMFTAMKQADNPRVAYNAAWQHPQNFVFAVG